MKAVTYSQYGPPEVLTLTEIAKPIPKADEILVKVRATSVNRTDCANLRAKPGIMRLTMGLLRPRKKILGTEFSGEVVEVGSSVQKFTINDKIFGFDDGGLSAYAEYLSISEKKAIGLMPIKSNFIQMACSLEGAHYAYNFINKVPLKEGNKVLVNGGSGGIGSAMVQLLKYYAAKITAVCDTKNIQLMYELGASKVIDYTQENFTNSTESYDYIFDCVGKSSFKACSPLLLPGGVYISSELGKNSINLALALISKIFGSVPNQMGKKVAFPYPPNKMRSLKLVKKLIEEGAFTPVIDRIYPLEEIKEAFTYVEKGVKTGNVAIALDELTEKNKEIF